MSDNVIWEPNPGSQVAGLACPTWELLMSGPRGTGKSEFLLADYVSEVGQGWPRWRGLITRPRYGDLTDLILKSQSWFHLAFPGARYTASPFPMWQFPDGERLEFRQLRTLEDYWKIHGQEFDWYGPDELTVMADPEPFLRTLTLVRGPDDGTPRRVRAATNPSGPGHNWVKKRYGLPLPGNRVVGDEIKARGERPRRAICGSIPENPHLEKDYVQSLRTACTSPAQLRAWLYGDWDITEGGMFDDLWSEKAHVIPDLGLEEIPQGWRLSRSFDWGAASPFSIGWTWTSDGTPVIKDGRILGEVRGDRIRWREWYGATPENKGLNLLNREIAQGITEREELWGVRERVRPGKADSAIFTKANGTGMSIAEDMARHGVRWLESEKGPGSRIQGWQQVRQLLAGALPVEEGRIREFPGLLICESCKAAREFLPSAPRDDKKPDDVDTDWDGDHVCDELRYEVFEKPRKVGRNSFRGKRKASTTWRR